MRNIATVAARPADEALLRVWVWLSVHRRVRAGLIIWCVLTLCWFVNVTTAQAADMALDNGSSSTFFLPIGHVTDTSGVPIGRYTELPLDYGRLSYPRRLIRGTILGFGWIAYTFVVFVLLAFVEFILSFMWLEWLASPIMLVGNSIDSALGSMGLVGLGLSVTALVVAFAVLRGHKGTAVVEILMVCVIAGLISTPLGNPMSYLTGEDSIVRESSEFGSELGDATVMEAEAGGDGVNEGEEQSSGSPISAELVDMTMRAPAQMISFGQELDGKCADVWDETAKDEGADAERLRKQVLRCNGDLKAGNETGSLHALGFYLMNWAGVIGLFFLIGVFGFFIIKDVMLALLGSLNVVIKGYLALFPGSGRFAFFNALGQLGVNVVMIALYIWALSAYLWVIGEIMSSINVLPMMLGSAFIGMIVIIMAVTFFMMKRRGKKVGESIARALSRNGLNSGQQPAQRKPSNLGRAALNSGMDAGVDGAKALAKRAMARRAATAGLAATGVGTAAATAITWAPRAASAARRSAGQQAPSAPQPAMAPGRPPAAALSYPGADKRAVPVGQPYVPEGPTEVAPPAPKPTPMQGRFNNMRVNMDGSTNVVSGEVVEGQLPNHLKASRAWGSNAQSIISGTPPPRASRSTAPRAASQAGGQR